MVGGLARDGGIEQGGVPVQWALRVVSTTPFGGFSLCGESPVPALQPPCTPSAAVRATKRKREAPTRLCCAGGEAAAPELLQKKTKPLQGERLGSPHHPIHVSSPTAPSSMMLEGHWGISTPLLPPGFAAVELVLPQGWDPPLCFALMRKINVTSSSILFWCSFPFRMARHSRQVLSARSFLPH